MFTDKQIQAVCKLLIDDGHCAYLDGRYQIAEHLYMLALSGLEATSELDALSQLSFLIGELFAEQGQTTESEEWYRYALQILDEHYPERAVDLAIVLKSLSEVCHAQSKFHEAAALRKRAEYMLSEARHHLDWQFRRPSAIPVADTSTPAKSTLSTGRSAAQALFMIGIMIVIVWLVGVYGPTVCGFFSDMGSSKIGLQDDVTSTQLLITNLGFPGNLILVR